MTELLVGAALLLVAATAQEPCAGKGTLLYLRTQERTLYVCERDRVRAAHRVALGRGGVGKRSEGDERVPVGSYSLGRPRASSRFHLFLPVGYPTAAQRQQGYTGGAVGVHGPHRLAQGAFSTLVDWTLGCIAVGTDEEIASIAAWVAEHDVRRILIAAQ